jgi:hypothetical protein
MGRRKGVVNPEQLRAVGVIVGFLIGALILIPLELWLITVLLKRD